MPKKSKIQTPEWVLKGFSSEEEYNKKKGIKAEKKEKGVFKLRLCPKCGSDEVVIATSKERSKEWECKKCKWVGANIKEKNVNEDEFMEYLDKKNIALPDEDELKKDFKKTIEMPDEEDFEE
jgi:ribosomal protein S27AE